MVKEQTNFVYRQYKPCAVLPFSVYKSSPVPLLLLLGDWGACGRWPLQPGWSQCWGAVTSRFPCVWNCLTRLSVHTLGMRSSAQTLSDVLPNRSANKEFTLSWIPPPLFHSYRINHEVLHILFPLILLNFLGDLSGSSLECSIGIADSSTYLWAVWYIFVPYLWYIVFSITTLSLFPSPVWTGHLLPYFDYNVNNKLEPGADLLSPDKITEAQIF